MDFLHVQVSLGKNVFYCTKSYSLAVLVHLAQVKN